MGNVMVIPAKRQVGNTSRSQDAKPKLRVAAYCRVSTDSDEQATSYKAQVEHYTEYIKKNPEWEFAGIYADDGISGTNTKNREEFNRMIEDCEAGTIDMIITKSISRFARNTLDCLKYIRQLKEKNIPVFFEKEAINTMDAKGEALLTIMASLAQQESQSLSQNVKLGLQFRYQNGQVQVNHNRFLGYTKDEEGNLVIDPEQAEVVKRIYREYLEGYSMDKIAAGLEADGILTGEVNHAGIQAPSTRFSATRNTSVMLFFKRLTPLIFLTRPELRTPESFRSIMLKETTKRLFQERFTCACKKNWYAGEWLRPALMVRNEATAATTAFHRLSFTAIVENCSEESIGTTVAASPSSGAASAS